MPGGVRDIHPPQARWKEDVERRLARLFDAWGYDPIVTPTLEFHDVLRIADGPDLDAQMFKLFDREGETLALRPEMTTSIARAVASRYRAEDLPLRLRYNGGVFRYERPQAGFQREFTQSGVELIGDGGAAADAEVVALAVAALRDLGVGGVLVDIGHAGFLEGLLASLQVSADLAAGLRRCAAEQDFVGLVRLAEAGGLASDQIERLEALPALRGGPEILSEAAAWVKDETAAAALARLEEVAGLLEAHGVAGHVRFDLGMIKELGYYTGLVLEGYTPELGFTLSTGGRYDNLLSRFGLDAPAIGFVVGVERVLLAQGKSAARPSVLDYVLVAETGRRREALDAAWRLRAMGRRAVVHLADRAEPEAAPEADRRRAARLVLIGGAEGGDVSVFEGGRVRSVGLDGLGDEEGAAGRGDRGA